MDPQDPQGAPGVAEPATPPAQAVPTPGETPVTTPEPEKQFVPLDRFQEVNNQLKELKEWRDSQEAAKAPVEPEPDIDPDTAKLLDSYLTRNGFVRQEDLAAKDAIVQRDRDLAEVKSQFGLSDQELEKVREAAVQAGAQNKAGLVHAYNTVFQDKIIEDKVKAALAQASSPETFAEKPGGSSQKPSEEGQKPGMSIKERVRQAARNA